MLEALEVDGKDGKVVRARTSKGWFTLVKNGERLAALVDALPKAEPPTSNATLAEQVGAAITGGGARHCHIRKVPAITGGGRADVIMQSSWSS